MWRKKNKVKHCCNLAAIASPVEVGTPGATVVDYVLEDGVSYLAKYSWQGRGFGVLWRLDLIKCLMAVVEGVRVEEACASVNMDLQEYTLLHT